MEKAVVPIIPGTISPITNIEAALQHARKIGYPIMLKAASGGGGVGLQVIHSEEELKKMFERIKERAGQLFGNEQLFIEKLIENARHIEVQVASDHYGNFVHRSEEHTSELQSRGHLVCRVLREKKNLALRRNGAGASSPSGGSLGLSGCARAGYNLNRPQLACGPTCGHRVVEALPSP